MSVISLADKRLQKGPHLAGEAQCLNPTCKHRWIAVAPHSITEWMECPQCSTMRGVWRNNFAPEGGALFVCVCSCEHFLITKIGGFCLGCGKTTTFEKLAELA